MKTIPLLLRMSAITLLLFLCACSSSAPPDSSEPSSLSAQDDGVVSSESVPGDVSQLPLESPGQIYLYGEQHAVPELLNKELELWGDYYQQENMRHLFIETPYYTAEYLNLWMESDSDEILDTLYDDWIGSAMHNPAVKEFYQEIKKKFPETVFHGTDVGHQFGTTGERFLDYLEANGRKDSDAYALTLVAIDQGKYFYEHDDNAYRENRMAENFIREFDPLDGESVMGIYGAAHTGLKGMDMETHSVPSMANQLNQRYGRSVQSEDLTFLLKDIDPIRLDTISVNDREYEALYFGREDLTGFRNFTYREFWRLENAYEDFRDNPKTGDSLPYDNYLMLIETGQVFVVDYGMTDGTVMRMYYRSDGNEWEGRPTTEEFTVE